jgi:maltooligosyltrehalose trehalohydrolase
MTSLPIPGCTFHGDGAEFAAWGPGLESLALLRGKTGETLPMRRAADGFWTLRVEGFRAGERYGFLPDGRGPFPDPASRFQPEGVHRLSQAVDLSGYPWRYPHPPLPAPARRSVYELHVGTFTPEGTFEAAAHRLPELRDLGVNLVELMPVADFPGSRNWGYDGVSLFAPARCYGSPESLCALVDEAHRLGLAVMLDVVYNHFGPDGNYTGVFSPGYLNPEKHTPWGAAIHFDGPGSEAVRAFFFANAVQWIRDYRFDGLRLDATHAILDDGEPHFLAELGENARRAAGGREILIHAEDHRNPARFVMPRGEGGFGLDGVWADDLHHHLRRKTAGDSEGYFAGFDGRMANIARTLERGWYRDGSAEEGPLAEGSDPDRLDYSRFVTCIQNHDQVGNRALGDRLHHAIPPDVYRALSALLLLAPETPLLFMGQEWACSSPFQYFTDHNEELGRLVTEGRRREFAGFSAFHDPAQRAAIPDPQAEATFLRSRLDWGERTRGRHAATLAFYRALLALRGGHGALDSVRKGSLRVTPSGEDGLVMVREGSAGRLACAVMLSPGGGSLDLAPPRGGGAGWRRLLTSEDGKFAADPRAIREESGGSGGIRLRYPRAGAWIGEG